MKIKYKLNVSKVKKSKIELAENLYSLYSMIEGNFFDWEDLLERVSSLHKKYPDLHTPELVPLIKKISKLVV